ncbi:DNA internalization competence protein ComEC/Rec2-like protein [uncultured Desulfobacterium sp.]|uniref:DNA internalization competence protein ComEC/Rec2-like protein n=1 Tax=uncultured Desulfobacterium sp. TaxID=201089 RepID=A0A445MTG1_9BACT|nr:DNA internalization competence protein ComEC/Rec2-like protein [uncultured Desulfobacterium sp.]
MSRRPLIPLAVSLAAGILFAHNTFSDSRPIMPLLLSASAILLLVTVKTSPWLRIPCLVISFFLTGAFLDVCTHIPSVLLPLANEHRHVVIQGTILEPPKISEGTARITIQVHTVFMGDVATALDEKIIATVYSNIPALTPCEKIRFPAKLRPFKGFNNPGRYDYESQMKINGFSCAASVSDGRYIVSEGRGNLPLYREVLEKFRMPIRTFFTQNLDPEEDAIYSAIILGETHKISPDLRESFNQTGLSHLLAVSGLHIALVAWLAFFIFKWCLSRSYSLTLKIDIKKYAAILTCIPVIGYSLIAGFQVSCQRAMIMGLAFLLSMILGREKETWSTLALSGLVILTTDPHAILGLSFLLSFGAVIGILWLNPVIMKTAPDLDEDRTKTIRHHIYLYFVGLVSVCLSATIFLLPIIVYYFHNISIASVPANVMTVPIIGLWVLPLGLLSVMVLPFSDLLAGLLLHLGAWGLGLMMDIIRFWASLSWSSIWVVTPNVFEIFSYYALLFCLYFIRHSKWAKIGFAALTLILIADIGFWVNRVYFNKDLRVCFIDVGQASAALVEFPGGKKMMIDGGGFSRDTFDVGRMVVAPFLWRQKISRIHYIVLSHPQADHMNGLKFIARAFHPEEFWHNGDMVSTQSFKDLLYIVEKNNVSRVLPKDLTGGRDINGALVEALHPVVHESSSQAFYAETDLNNNSLVLKISFHKKSFLFPGDLEKNGENSLISEANISLKSDVLLSPHHGSKTSNTEGFLKMVAPKICVISSGEGNFFGFPHKEALERLQSAECKIIRIDQSGAVQFTVGEENLEFTTFFGSR